MRNPRGFFVSHDSNFGNKGNCPGKCPKTGKCPGKCRSFHSREDSPQARAPRGIKTTDETPTSQKNKSSVFHHNHHHPQSTHAMASSFYHLGLQSKNTLLIITQGLMLLAARRCGANDNQQRVTSNSAWTKQRLPWRPTQQTKKTLHLHVGAQQPTLFIF